MLRDKILEIIDSNRNLIVEGDVASGKTTNVFFPIIDELINKKENLFLLDSKAEYIKEYSQKLKEKGYNVLVLNIKDADKSELWNPLMLPYKLYKEENKEKAIELISLIAKQLINNEKATDSFWSDTAANYFTGITLALFEKAQKNEINLNSIARFIEESDLHSEGFNFYANDYFNQFDKDSLPYTYVSETLDSPKETKAGILSVAKQKIKLYTTRENTTRFLSRSTFDMCTITEKPTAIIFEAHESLTGINNVVNIFIEQLYNTLPKNNKEKMNFILDNINTLPTIQSLISMFDKCQNNNSKFYLETRSLNDLEIQYTNYIEEISDLITINKDTLDITIEKEKSTIDKNFHTYIEPETEVIYPEIPEEEITIFSLKNYIENKLNN